MAYADTGFLVSLYLPESTTVAARALVRESGLAPIAVTSFVLMEVRNALNLATFRKRLSPGERDAVWSVMQAHATSGFLVMRVIAHEQALERARELSDRHTPATGARTLDLLHVAAALLLGERTFLSFDERQRAVARAERLRVRPGDLV